jgi:hypothetical protein
MTDKLDKATLGLKLRQLYDDSPEAFEDIIGQLLKMASADATLGPGDIPMEGVADYLNWVLPPVKIVRGKPVKLDDLSLALLLSRYRCRDGGREEFIDEEQGRLWGNGYTLGTVNIEEHLKAAEKREKSDAVFAEIVASFTSQGAWLRSLPNFPLR